MKISDIKKQASLSLEGSLFKAIGITIFYTIITVLFGFIPTLLKSTISNGILTLLTILINIALLPFSYGMIISLIKISKDEKTTFTDFINIGLLNYFKIIKLILMITLRLIPYVILLVVGSILIISNFENDAIKVLGLILYFISLALIIFKALDYILFSFINHDDSKKTCKEILLESKKIMKKNKLRFILLAFSYILWFILLGLLLNIINYFVSKDILTIISYLFLSLLTPFITVSQFILYEDLKNNIKE